LQECIEPVFLLYEDGKRFKTFIRIDGPGIEEALQELKEILEQENPPEKKILVGVSR